MDINAKLVDLQAKAELSVADMGYWFGVHGQTMNTWLRGVHPHAYRHSQIGAKLHLLEKAIANGNYFPVPITITQFQRKNYLQQVLNAVSGGVSQAYPTE